MSSQTIQQSSYGIKEGKFPDIYRLFVPLTINTGTLISADRIADTGLRNTWFYTANVPLATKRNGRLLLGIGGNAAFNAVFGADTEGAYHELIDKWYVHLNQAQKEFILYLEKSGEVIFVEPEPLELGLSLHGHRFFPVRTQSYLKDVTTSRMPFVGAGFGWGYTLERVMENLSKAGIHEIKVYMIKPDQAAESVEDDEIIARLAGLDRFGDSSNFGANIRCIDGITGALRGTLKNPLESGAKTHLEDLV